MKRKILIICHNCDYISTGLISGKRKNERDYDIKEHRKKSIICIVVIEKNKFS